MTVRTIIFTVTVDLSELHETQHKALALAMELLEAIDAVTVKADWGK